MPPRSNDVTNGAEPAATAGAMAAFARMVEEYQDRSVRHASRLLGDWELAQDVAQDTFVAAYEAMGTRRPAASLAARLFRMATNKALDRLQRRRLIRWLGLDADRPPVNLLPRVFERLQGRAAAPARRLLR